MAEVFRLDDKVVCVVDEKEAELLRAVLGRLNSTGSGPNRAWKSHDLYMGLVNADVEKCLHFKSFYEAEEIKTT